MMDQLTFPVLMEHYFDEYELFRAMEVRGVGGGELGSSTVVMNSDGELQYELNQQTNSFLTNTHLVQQGESS